MRRRGKLKESLKISWSFKAHPLDPEISASLREMRDLTASLRVFGSYRADREGGLVASGA